MDFFELFSDVPENLVVVSPEYKILAATNAYLQVTMRSREDIVGLHFLLEAFPEKDTPYEENPVKLALDKTLATKQVLVMDIIRYDLVIPEEEGGGYKELYWETFYIPGLDAQGNIKYIIQKAVNVTERELAKRAQKESETKFKVIMDAVPQLIYTADATGKLTHINERWTHYTGLSAEEAITSKTAWIEAVHPEDREIMLERAAKSFREGTEFQMEVRLRNKEGHYRWFLSKSTPVRLEGKDEVTTWVGFSSDIHSTKQMVQELLETNEQMVLLADQVQLAYNKAESQRLTLERLIMQAPAIFAITKGPEHRFDLVNPNYQKLFPNRNLLGKTVVEAVPEVIEQGFIQILDTVYTTGVSFQADEIPVKADWQNNGEVTEAFFTTTYQPLLDGADVVGIIAFGYEVTDRVKLRRELQELKNA